MTNEDENTALLVMDVQPGILAQLQDGDAHLAKVTTVVEVAHKKQIPVVYVVVGFRPGMPEVSDHQKSFSGITEEAAAVMIDPHPVLTP